VTLSPVPTVLGGVSITYAVTTQTGASCSIADSSVPAVAVSGSGTCVVRATSAEGVYAQATATATLTVFDGAGSGNV
jgi:hypothetical protein